MIIKNHTINQKTHFLLPRFQQLQSYYNILDRALKLEKKSSSMEIHKLKSEAVIDFETWRKLRQKEKAGDELQMLMSSLREAQRARQFHFRPKEVASIRWKGDIRLRARDKSVENLKNHFTKIAEQKGLTDEIQNKMVEINEVKDVYKPKWRASTINTNIKRLNNAGKFLKRMTKLENKLNSLDPNGRSLLRHIQTECLL